MFSWSGNFLQVIFGWEQWEENNNITRNSSKSDILTLLALLNVDVKSALLLRVSTLTKVEETQFRVATWFMDNLLCLCDMWKCRSYVNVIVSVSSIFNNGQFYLRHRNSLSKRFS